MGSPWAPIVVPFAKGLDRSKESAQGQDELHTALNVDYPVDGMAQGRPSRSAPAQFVVRDPASEFATAPAYLAASSFASTGFSPNGLHRLRDITSERVALSTQGRLFSKEGSEWVDRGHFACAKTARIGGFEQWPNDPSTARCVVAQDFGVTRDGSSATKYFALMTSAGARQKEQALSVGASPGNSARCGTTTAAVFRDNSSHLQFVYRTAGSSTLTMVQIATGDARSPNEVGDAPSICCSHDATVFWVAYRTTTANTFKVLRVTTTGSVTATYTSGAEAGLSALWVDNTDAATGQVVVAFTHDTGVTVRTLDATTLVDAAADSDYDDAGNDGESVVIGTMGGSQSGAYWLVFLSNSGSNMDLMFLAGLTGSAASLSLRRKCFGGPSSDAAVIWGICHQPVWVNGRAYVTVCANTWLDSNTGTWLTLDLSSWYSTVADTGPFSSPTLVARGPSGGTYTHSQPSSASTFSDGTGWSFATLDWNEFELSSSGGVVGLGVTNVQNRVTLSQPRSVQAGEATIFSGSVPHMVAGGDCVELGFPFLGGVPGIGTFDTTGGSMALGDYGVVACWRWTDAAGQIHRSAPTAVITTEVAGANNAITVHVTNPWFTEKYGSAQDTQLVIEVYCTEVDPAETALHYLQATSVPAYTAAYTAITLTTPPDTTGEPLYTDGDVKANYHVRGDGGIATLGRRVWMADGSTVYASKYVERGYGPAFNDQGQHQVNLPPSAGRVVALESLDDKLIILCERGIYMTQDGGPDNTGVGADFASPVRLSDLGIAGPRSSCLTDQGVLFCSPLDATDPSRGGPWLIDRQFTFTERQFLGRQARDFFLRSSSWIPEVAYSPERQQAYITTNIANGSSHGVVVVDLRVGKWAVWDTRSATTGSLRHIACVGGVLWALNTEAAAFDGTPGTDAGGVGDYPMVLKTSHLAGDGQNTMGWARVRAVRALAAEGTGAHTLTMTVVLDKTRTHTSDPYVLAAPSADTTWPSTDQKPEWRLPVQKCSSIQVQLSATPALARWAAIRLDVAPLPLVGPAKNRS